MDAIEIDIDRHNVRVFLAQTERSGDCLLWIGKGVVPRHAAYEMAFGERVARITSTCGNPRCVNVLHYRRC